MKNGPNYPITQRLTNTNVFWVIGSLIVGVVLFAYVYWTEEEGGDISDVGADVLDSIEENKVYLGVLILVIFLVLVGFLI